MSVRIKLVCKPFIGVLRLASRWLVLASLPMAALGVSACERQPRPPTASQAVLMRSGKHVLTLGELQAQVDQMSVQKRAQYTTPEQQQKFVANAVEQEILAVEAERLNYQNAPEVVSAMKRAMVLKLLKERVGNGPQPGEVTEAVMRQYYQSHQSEFGPPDRARVAIILIKDSAKARQVMAEAERAVVESASTRHIEERFSAFAELVKRYTEEPGARDVTLSLSLAGAGYPKAVMDAASALREVGGLSPLVVTDEAYYILQLKERLPGSVKPFEEVKAHVARSASEQVRDRKIAEFVTSLTQKPDVQIFRNEFGAVRFDKAEPSPFVAGN